MKMQDHLDTCKRRARQIKSDYPDKGYNERLSVAAQEQGFRHYTTLRKLYDLLGPDQTPSRLAITRAGGDASESPYRSVSREFELSWTNSVLATEQ